MVIKFVEIDPQRASRFAPAASFEVDGIGMWMYAEDIEANIKERGHNPELQKALEAYQAHRKKQ